MAILMQDDIFKCPKCRHLEFSPKSVESYTVNINRDGSTSLLPNTKKTVLICDKCNERIELSNDLKLERADD